MALTVSPNYSVDINSFIYTAFSHISRHQRTSLDSTSLSDAGTGTRASATIRQLVQSILDEAMRHPDRLGKLPATMQERIRRLQHRGDDRDPGSPSGSTLRDTRVPEARGDIPKPAPASAATVRTVEKEVLKEVHTYRPQPEVQVSGPDVPRRFRQPPQDQQRNLMARLRGLSLEQRRAMLARMGCALRIWWGTQRHRLSL